MVRNTLLRLPAAALARGKSRSGQYLDIKNGLLTTPIRIGLRAVAWPQSEIEILNAARISGKTDEEIRLLVKSLEAARKAAE